MKAQSIARVSFTVKKENYEKAQKFFGDLFECEFPEGGGGGETESFDIIETGDDHVGFDVCTTLSTQGATAQRLAKYGEGLTMVSIKVPPEDFERDVAQMWRRGIRLIDKGKTPTFRYAVFHPKDTYGLMIELTDHSTRNRDI